MTPLTIVQYDLLILVLKGLMMVRLLAIGAHPDDVILGAGGLIARMSSAPHTAHILTVTSGELGGGADIREFEDRRAAKRLGATIEFGRLVDGALAMRETIDLITSAVERFRPTIVATHEPNDSHQDHVVTSRASRIASRSVDTFLYYEGPSTIGFDPTTTLTIDDEWQAKVEALHMHGSQVTARSLDFWLNNVAGFRAWPRFAGSRCEAYRIAHASFSAIFERSARAPDVEPRIAAQ